MYQAGTLSGNPLAMAAGMATLRELMNHHETIYPRLERTTAAIADGVDSIARELDVPLTTNRVGAMFTWFFYGGPVYDFSSAARSDTAAFGQFHRALLDSGVWLPPSQFEAAFISAAHGPEEVKAILAAARDALSGVREAATAVS